MQVKYYHKIFLINRNRKTTHCIYQKRQACILSICSVLQVSTRNLLSSLITLTHTRCVWPWQSLKATVSHRTSLQKMATHAMKIKQDAAKSTSTVQHLQRRICFLFTVISLLSSTVLSQFPFSISKQSLWIFRKPKMFILIGDMCKYHLILC